MARVVIVNGRIYKETATRVVTVGGGIFKETIAAASGGRIMSSLASHGGLAGKGGIAGKSGGLAG